MKFPYIPPELEVFEFAVECTSGLSIYVHDHDINNTEPFTETRTESNNWITDNDEGFWGNSW